ncbi:DUF2087 domain-containing protein [Streptobacillus ratti]|uniref:DUF2087 domain-containing protein n=1 Tax=Streptobacillus ratti TaxID=1720557 RepID=UPI0039EB696D
MLYFSLKGFSLIWCPNLIIAETFLFFIFFVTYVLSHNINEILKEYFEDYVLLRRYLVDFKYLSRDKNGKIYKKVDNK